MVDGCSEVFLFTCGAWALWVLGSFPTFVPCLVVLPSLVFLSVSVQRATGGMIFGVHVRWCYWVPWTWGVLAVVFWSFGARDLAVLAVSAVFVVFGCLRGLRCFRCLRCLCGCRLADVVGCCRFAVHPGCSTVGPSAACLAGAGPGCLRGAGARFPDMT